MSTIATPGSPGGFRTKNNVETTVSIYDRVSGFLIASISILGVLSFIMFLIWLTMVSDGPPKKKILEFVPPGDPGEEKPEGVEDDVLEPGVEEFPEVEVPQLADALEAVTDAPSRTRANLAKVDGNAAEMGRGRGLGAINGGGNGGGGRGFERWRIEYNSTNRDIYISQLDFFKIDIGVVSKKSDAIDLVKNLAASPPTRVRSFREEEQRVYFRHNKGRLISWDKNLALRAGVTDTKGKIMVQFYHPDTTQLLARLEFEEAEKRGLDVRKSVKTTIFGVRGSPGNYEYFVSDMIPY